MKIHDDSVEQQLQLDDEEGSPHESDVLRLSELECTVRFWIEGKRLLLQELRALHPGSVIVCNQRLADAEVVVEVDGQRIGRGALMAVGDRLGVRLTRLMHMDR